ncbi:translation initiation factor IF-2-like [Marmota marmota marmota]|uniref:translation initiation factor IF-2-like n=1 Tax=Marmota marmota marmota TaxID=9994 RepID=UPI002091F1B5|nr:translation initiation factor IF-2-like [Marmota marmota marmota]
MNPEAAGRSRIPPNKGPPSWDGRRTLVAQSSPTRCPPRAASRPGHHGWRPTPRAEPPLTRCDRPRSSPATPGSPAAPWPAWSSDPAAPSRVRSVRSEPGPGAPPLARPGLPADPAAGGCPPDPTSDSGPGSGRLLLTNSQAALPGQNAGGTPGRGRGSAGGALGRSTFPEFGWLLAAAARPHFRLSSELETNKQTKHRRSRGGSDARDLGPGHASGVALVTGGGGARTVTQLAFCLAEKGTGKLKVPGWSPPGGWLKSFSPSVAPFHTA